MFKSKKITALGIIASVSCVTLSLQSCNKKSVEVKLSKTKKPAQKDPDKSTGETIEVVNGLKGQKVYYQTRSPIALTMSQDIISNGDKFSLENKTTSQALITDETYATSLALSSFEIVELPSFELSTSSTAIRLYPTDTANASKFAYGENELKLTVQHDGDTKYSTYKITRKDFKLFTVGTSAFSTNKPRPSGLEVAPAPFVKASLSNGTHTMDITPIGMMSR